MRKSDFNGLRDMAGLQRRISAMQELVSQVRHEDEIYYLDVPDMMRNKGDLQLTAIPYRQGTELIGVVVEHAYYDDDTEQNEVYTESFQLQFPNLEDDKTA